MIGPIREARIVEIGSDADAGLLRELCSRWGVAQCVGVNPSVSSVVIDDGIELVKGDCRSLPFPDEFFDAAVSISVFEHVTCLPEVLKELYRVLKPGGTLYSEFGPIWSSVWGHHLWLYYDSDVITWTTHPLPPYAHLLMAPDQLASWCHREFKDPVLAERVAEFVFDSPEQNRLFFSDYVRIFEESPFEALLVTGCPDLPTGKWAGMDNVETSLSKLNERFPGKSGFGYHVIRVLLRKPDDSHEGPA